MLQQLQTWKLHPAWIDSLLVLATKVKRKDIDEHSGVATSSDGAEMRQLTLRVFPLSAENCSTRKMLLVDTDLKKP